MHEDDSLLLTSGAIRRLNILMMKMKEFNIAGCLHGRKHCDADWVKSIIEKMSLSCHTAQIAMQSVEETLLCSRRSKTAEEASIFGSYLSSLMKYYIRLWLFLLGKKNTNCIQICI